MGLRQKQKAARERRILQAAVTKFRADGYHAVRIDDLASMAEVSVGTIYNYYRNKADILIATVAMEVEEVLVAGEKVVAAPPNGVENAVLTLIYGYYDHSLHYLSKEMWRSAMALSIEAADTPNGQRYTELDARLAQQVKALIAALKGKGEVRAELDADALGQLIFNALNQEFIEFIKQDEMALAELHKRIDAQMRPLFALLAPPSTT